MYMRLSDTPCKLRLECRPNHDGILRSYQQEALHKLKQPGNYILAAPTGMHVSLRMLCRFCTVFHKAQQHTDSITKHEHVAVILDQFFQ